MSSDGKQVRPASAYLSRIRSRTPRSKDVLELAIAQAFKIVFAQDKYTAMMNSRMVLLVKAGAGAKPRSNVDVVLHSAEVRRQLPSSYVS